MGRLCAEGCGVRKDPRAALRWYERAADGGLAEAFYFVGAAYTFGDGTKPDQRLALKWFQRAASAGDLDGEYMYALGVFEGKGQRRDAARGMELLLEAARRASLHAMDYLAAHSLERGQIAAGRRWASKAAKLGDPAVRLRLRLQTRAPQA
jgi:TPR repeat protein